MISADKNQSGSGFPPATEGPARTVDAGQEFRFSLLLDCIQALHARLEVPVILETLANRVRNLFSARMVLVLAGDGSSFRLQAVSAEDQFSAWSDRGSDEKRRLSFLEHVARAAVEAGTTMLTPLRSQQLHDLDFAGATEILAIPLRTAGSSPAVLLLCSGPEHPVSSEESTLLARICNTAALAISNAELCAAADSQARVSRELLNLSKDLNTFSRSSTTLASFVEQASGILAASAVAVALPVAGRLEVRAIQPAVNPELLPRLAAAMEEIQGRSSSPLAYGLAHDLLGASLATSLGWHNVTITNSRDADGSLLAVLCIADPPSAVPQVLPSLVELLSLAVANARQFTRMHEANRHWIEVFDAISDFILVHDSEFRVLRVNRPLAEFIGVAPKDLIGLTTQAVLTLASDTSGRQCPFCSTGSHGVDQYVHPAFDRTYLVSTSQIAGEASENRQTVHVLKDVTDREEAERRYRELFDTIQEGIFFSTPEGRFVEVNDALVRMLGYQAREELLQVEIPRQIYFQPEQRARLVAELESRGSVRNYEETLRRKDGALIHTLQNAFAVRDSQGRVVQYRGLLLDITEQKNFQAELQRQRDFNTKILNNTQSMILVLDPAGTITYANRRCFEAGGYGHEDLIGHPLLNLIPPGRRHVLSEALSEVLAGKHVDNLEVPVLLGQGRGGQFSVNLSPMRDESGGISSLVVVMTDITDAAMLQAKLTHTEKMAAVGQLVSGVAHEVNNPLTAILGFADLLLEHPDIPDSPRKDLRIILHEAQRTKQIVQNLLSFARQMPPQRVPLQLNDIVRRTLSLRNYDFASHGVQVVERLQERLPQVVGDPHQLQQVFLNILNNAYDAVRDSGRPGRIEVSTTSPSPGVVEVSFRDNGSGVLYPDRIFDPFFTTKEVGKGTGLGLSICYGILREHGGEITCRNNADQGATFIVRLPLNALPLESGPAAGRSQTNGSNHIVASGPHGDSGGSV
ncbi:MAG: PAS domain S-box protein [Candidatus Korobacteraceae bacterium]